MGSGAGRGSHGRAEVPGPDGVPGGRGPSRAGGLLGRQGSRSRARFWAGQGSQAGRGTQATGVPGRAGVPERTEVREPDEVAGRRSRGWTGVPGGRGPGPGWGPRRVWQVREGRRKVATLVGGRRPERLWDGDAEGD